jgi:hypothetical protein
MLNAQQIFKNLLPHLWLRPERALWDSIELGAVSKMLLPNLKSPSMEYGCTDGLNTFVMLGGRLNFEYDDYMDIPDSEFNKGVLRNRDLFEAIPKDIHLQIITTPIAQFDLGLSWKESHLKRANRLGVYKSLELMKFDKVDGAGFGTFETIWAPQLFWTSKEFILEKLKDLHSMLNESGSLITIFPTELQKSEEIMQKLNLPSEVFEILDKGISNNFCKNARAAAEWEELFNRANLVLVEKSGFIDPIIGGFYQFGFRPLLAPMLKMHYALKDAPSGKLMELKKGWVNTIHQFVDPLISRHESCNSLGKHLWIVCRLKRKS